MSDLVAQLDQFHAALTQVARMLGHYRRELIDAGFPPGEALELCVDMQRAVVFGDGCAEGDCVEGDEGEEDQ